MLPTRDVVRYCDLGRSHLCSLPSSKLEAKDQYNQYSPRPPNPSPSPLEYAQIQTVLHLGQTLRLVTVQSDNGTEGSDLIHRCSTLSTAAACPRSRDQRSESLATDSNLRRLPRSPGRARDPLLRVNGEELDSLKDRA